MVKKDGSILTLTKKFWEVALFWGTDTSAMGGDMSPYMQRHLRVNCSTVFRIVSF